MPGIIFAADYDLGRTDEAYHDQSTNSPCNSGGAYRNDSVDIAASSDAPPTIGYAVGWLEAGDWMKYTLTPVVPGPYAVSARVATAIAGGSFYLEVAGSNVTGIINVPVTGGWQSWVTLPARVFTNALPMTSFRLKIVSGEFNANWLRFDSVAPADPQRPVRDRTNTQASLNWNPARRHPATISNARPPTAYPTRRSQPVSPPPITPTRR